MVSLLEKEKMRISMNDRCSAVQFSDRSLKEENDDEMQN